MNTTICFDMDGTIADLYGVQNWLEMLRAENPQPYRQAKPLLDIKKLNRQLKKLQKMGFRIAIISWCAKDATNEYNKAVRKAKREWLKYHNFPADEIHIVKYGTPKQQTVKNDCLFLFDDDMQVREKWERPNKNRKAFTEKEIFDIISQILRGDYHDFQRETIASA